MDNFQKLRWHVRVSILSMLLCTSIFTVATWACCRWYFGFNDILSAIIAIAAGILLSFLSAEILTDLSLEPIKTVRQALLHIDPNHHNVPAPNIDKVRFGRELVNAMTLRLYQYASQQDSTELARHRAEIVQATSVVSHMPLPLFVFNKDLLVTNASDNALVYCGVESSKLFGKPIFDNINLEFQSTETLEKWIAECQGSKVTDTNYWERVRVITPDGIQRQCDLAAYYNRENTSGTEFIVTFFDRTGQYGKDDDSMSFISLAVHELRTPLTILKGYIEVFEEEVAPVLDKEMRDYMRKMSTSADQLSSFVRNVLNVARIQNNQLALHLTEANWEETIRAGAAAMCRRAEIEGKQIEFNFSPNLPTVAVDHITIQEVINNLLDNAIKYSVGPKSKRIVVTSSLNKEGLVETTVQDFGVGIPGEIVPHVFDKYYRNHRTREVVSGTGLGLFLCKSVVVAHDGKIWANSKVGEGSTFGFTVLPYSRLADSKKASGEIVRQANGWIKNHSYYRD